MPLSAVATATANVATVAVAMAKNGVCVDIWVRSNAAVVKSTVADAARRAATNAANARW